MVPAPSSPALTPALLTAIAERFGTPTWVYDLDAMDDAAGALEAAFDGAPHLVAYAVKANSAGPLLKRFAARGLGADVVSGVELALAMAAGISPEKIVFSGVAKTNDEIDRALLAGDRGILALQAESAEELHRIAARATTLGRIARVAIRINPELASIDTHQGIATGHDDAKFGVPVSDLAPAYAALEAPSLAFQGLSVHAGSQLLSTGDYLEAARILLRTAKDCPRRSELRFLDSGGGFGIDYGDQEPVPPGRFVAETRALCKEFGFGDLPLHIEPGRVLVAPYGHLLTRVVQRKEVAASGGSKRRWLMIDAGMNDLVRPAMYQARHRVTPIADGDSSKDLAEFRVVGPICESSDDFGFHRLPEGLPDGALVLLRDGGAYGYPMASRYNGRGFAAEVFVTGGTVGAAKEREPEQAFLDDRLRF